MSDLSTVYCQDLKPQDHDQDSEPQDQEQDSVLVLVSTLVPDLGAWLDQELTFASQIHRLLGIATISSASYALFPNAQCY